MISVDKENAVIIWDVESEGLDLNTSSLILALQSNSKAKVIPLTHKCHCADFFFFLPLFSDEYLQISFDKSTFEVGALMHPSTYLNKILFGSSQGSLQLWNVKSKYMKVFFCFF